MPKHVVLARDNKMFFDNLGDRAMKMRSFREKVAARIKEVNSCVCLGLDSDYNKLPACVKRRGFKEDVSRFNRVLIDATYDVLLAIKANAAFYEAHGGEGKQALKRMFDYCRQKAPGVIRIVDYKRADIGNSNLGYVAEAFKYFGADAVTVNPYFGREAMQPFLDQQDKGIIVLCKTSNPGGGEFQDLMVTPPEVGAALADFLDNDGQLPLHQYVAWQVSRVWDKRYNCALVVGATYPEQAEIVRWIAPDMPLLIPGIGKQEGALKETVEAAQDSQGGGMIINSSRGIIFASGGEDFVDVARREVLKLRDEINQYRKTD